MHGKQRWGTVLSLDVEGREASFLFLVSCRFSSHVMSEKEFSSNIPFFPRRKRTCLNTLFFSQPFILCVLCLRLSYTCLMRPTNFSRRRRRKRKTKILSCHVSVSLSVGSSLCFFYLFSFPLPFTHGIYKNLQDSMKCRVKGTNETEMKSQQKSKKYRRQV